MISTAEPALPQLKCNEDKLRMFLPGLVTNFTDSLKWDDGISMQL